jgi:hypothetical protein
LTAPYSRTLGAAVATLSLALMTTELVITRIFSVIIWYHFAFFAISVALFGTGAAATLVHLFQRRLLAGRGATVLTASAACFAVTVVVVDFLLVRVVPLWFGGLFTATYLSTTGRIVALFAMAAAPFFVGGFTLSLAIARHARELHRVYSADLFGAAFGCLAAVPLLSGLGGPGALLAAASAGGVAALLFARSEPSGVRPSVTRVAALAVLVAVGGGALAARAGALDVKVGKAVDLERFPPEFAEWNSFSHVTVLPVGGFRGWGTSPKYKGPVPEQRALFIDLAALTMLTRFDGDFRGVEYVLHDLSAFVFGIKRAPRETCVIGAGGGKDVLASLAAGSRHVTAVEINPLIVDGVVRGKFRAFTGGLYSRPDVDVFVEDGRSFVRKTNRRFDVLLLSMVDTSAATAAGAFALTENSLYTSDAFADFLSRLAPGGVLSVSTVSFPSLAVGTRLVAIARDALARRGVAAERAVVVVQTPWLNGGGTMHDVLVKPSGFTPDEVDGLRRHADALGFTVAYAPGATSPLPGVENAWTYEVLTTKSPATLARTMDTWPVDASAVDDSRPFFFYQDRLRDFLPALFMIGSAHPFGNGLVVLAKVLLVSVLFVAAFLLVPLVFSRKELSLGDGRPGWDLAYVSSLGLGFMFVEIALVQRFTLYLGHPTYTLAVVLLVVLMGGGLGSRWLGGSGAQGGRRRLATLLAAIVVAILVVRVVAPHVFAATLAWPIAARAVVAAVLLGPIGFLLGVPYPMGLGAVAARAPLRVPWLWAMNSATSVLGSVLATVVSLHGGIDASIGAGAGLYLCALLLAGRVMRDGGARVAPVGEPGGRSG